MKTEKPGFAAGLFRLQSGNFLLSHTLARAVPSGLRGLTTVFGMGTGGTHLAMVTQKVVIPNIDVQPLKPKTLCVDNKFYGQAERAISSG